MKRKNERFSCPALLAVALNLLLLYAAYFVTRVAFFLENYHTYKHILGSGKLLTIIAGGFYFDTSAIAYTNALYVLLVLLPLHSKETDLWQRLCKGLFMLVNGLALAVNLADTVYFQFTGRRTTMAFFSEFGSDDKLGSIVALEFLNHWYLVLLFVLLMAMLWVGYRKPKTTLRPLPRYYLVQICSLIVAAILCWAGMRGGFWDNRPIKVSTANQFIVKPNDASLILNTPFSLIRTIGKANYHDPAFFTQEELERIYTPVHLPTVQNDTTATTPPNVVVIFLESFGREYVGSLNRDRLPGYQGYTPFLDSLMQHAVSFRYTFANGRSSIDAMPSALSGLPMFVESFVAASHSINHLDGLAGYLGRMGYESAFFHGAPASSLGFQGFAKSTGVQKCWSQEDYEADPRTNGKADSDNWWGIWDEPFLQYFCSKMSDMQPPFMTALFTLTSHHPFHIPSQYKDIFTEGEMPIHKCIRYTDHALKRFFEQASHKPWFQNTLFVLTGDHTNMSNHEEYRNTTGLFSTTLIFYAPNGRMEPGIREGIAQQTDILPTVLGYVGYDQPYFAFGSDLLHTPAKDTWAINYLDGVYQYCKGEHVLQFDGESTIGLYRLDDYRMEKNMMGQASCQTQMELETKAIIQQYMSRMIENKLTIE